VESEIMSQRVLWKSTAWLRMFALWKIPLIAAVRPRVLALDDAACIIRIPLNHYNRNHLRSLYFGALCIGADLAGGLIIMEMIRKRRSRVAFLFKDFHADFHKRAEGATIFTCRDGEMLAQLLAEAEETGERCEGTVRVTATCPDKLGDEPVADFRLTISMKRRS